MLRPPLVKSSLTLLRNLYQYLYFLMHSWPKSTTTTWLSLVTVSPPGRFSLESLESIVDKISPPGIRRTWSVFLFFSDLATMIRFSESTDNPPYLPRSRKNEIGFKKKFCNRWVSFFLLLPSLFPISSMKSPFGENICILVSATIIDPPGPMQTEDIRLKQPFVFPFFPT